MEATEATQNMDNFFAPITKKSDPLTDVPVGEVTENVVKAICKASSVEDKAELEKRWPTIYSINKSLKLVGENDDNVSISKSSYEQLKKDAEGGGEVDITVSEAISIVNKRLSDTKEETKTTETKKADQTKNDDFESFASDEKDWGPDPDGLK